MEATFRGYQWVCWLLERKKIPVKSIRTYYYSVLSLSSSFFCCWMWSYNIISCCMLRVYMYIYIEHAGNCYWAREREMMIRWYGLVVWWHGWWRRLLWRPKKTKWLWWWSTSENNATFPFFLHFPRIIASSSIHVFFSFDSSQDYHWLFDGSLCQQIIHDGRVVGSRHRCNNNTYINIFGPLRWDLTRRVLSCTYPCTWFFLLRGWCDKKLWDGEKYVVLFVIWRR